MNHAIFSGIPVVAIGLALSAELKVAVAMIGHEEQLFRWVWCRKTPASVCSGPLGESMKLSQPAVFVRLVRGQGHRRAVAGGHICFHGVALINDSPKNGPTSWHFACRTQFSSGEVTGGGGAAGSAPLKSRFLFFFLFFGAAGLAVVVHRGLHLPRPTPLPPSRTFPKTHTNARSALEKIPKRSLN